MLKQILFSLLLITSITGNIMARATLQELETKQKQAKELVEAGTIYYHYRDANLKYQVIEVGIQEATEDVCVVYKSLYGDGVIWIRNLNSWLGEVEHDGQMVKRFKKL